MLAMCRVVMLGDVRELRAGRGRRGLYVVARVGGDAFGIRVEWISRVGASVGMRPADRLNIYTIGID